MNQQDYFLALWRDCQESVKPDCENCIVPKDLCNKWNEELQQED